MKFQWRYSGGIEKRVATKGILYKSNMEYNIYEETRTRVKSV